MKIHTEKKMQIGLREGFLQEKSSEISPKRKNLNYSASYRCKL